MNLKSLAEDDRPREKFLLKGRNALSDSELLAIIMGSGNREESAVDLARKILNSTGNNWNTLSRLSLKDLMKFNGIGEAKAVSIAAALEIGRRKAQQEVPQKIKISDAKTAYEVLSPWLEDLQTEEFWAVFLNQSNEIIYRSQLTKGGISETIVDVRILFRTALEHFATGIIVAHNHPSGSLKPSEADIKVTRKVKEAGKVLDINIIDHLIISHKGFFSFAEEGLL
ncbi:MAG: DNA repair protein RadC [Bergeyella sp.]